MDKRLVVAIDTWDSDSMYPSGHYVRTLGIIGDRDTETVRGGCEGDKGAEGERRHIRMGCICPPPSVCTAKGFAAERTLLLSRRYLADDPPRTPASHPPCRKCC